MDRIRIITLVASIWLLFASTALAVTGQGIWIAFPNGTTCPNYNTAPINDQTLCYDSVSGWQAFSSSVWKSPLLGGVPCSQLPALTGDTTTTAGSCATTTAQVHWTTRTVVNAQSPYTVAATDTVMLCNAVGGAITFNLPASTGGGRFLFFKKIDSSANTCTITRAGADTIDGVTSSLLSAQFDEATLIDGASGTWNQSDFGVLPVASGGTGLTTTSTTPGGRLTLTTATPVMSADASAQGTIFYDTFVSNIVPVNGTNLTITSNEISVILDATNDLSGSLYDVFAINSSGSLKLCTGPAWTNSTTRSQAIALSNGVWTNSGSMTNCFNNSVNQGPIASGAGTYLGTFDATANGQTSMRFHPAAAGGGSLASTTCALCLYNGYNRVPLSSTSLDNTATWTYATATWRAADNNNNNRVTYVDGLGQSVVTCTYGVLNTGAVAAITGCDLNSTSATPSNPAYSQSANGGWNYSATDLVPTLGLNFSQAVEYSSGATSTFYGTGGNGTQQTQSLVTRLTM